MRGGARRKQGTPTGAARQARAAQGLQFELAHGEHDSIEVVAPGKAPSGKTHNPTFPCERFDYLGLDPSRPGAAIGFRESISRIFVMNTSMSNGLLRTST